MTKKKLFNANTTYVVRGGGGIIAETKNAVILALEGQSDRIFFPQSDIAMVLLDPSETSAKDPKLGEAQYYHISGKSAPVIDAAWGYDKTADEFSALENLITFDDTKVTVEAL